MAGVTLIAYPYTFLTVRAALQRMDPSLLEAALNLRPLLRWVFWRVTLPNLRPPLLAGSLLVALYCVRDFGAVNLLQYGTFTRVIFNRYQAFRLDEAAAMALLLVGLTAVLLWLDYRSRGRARYTRLSAGCACSRLSHRRALAYGSCRRWPLWVAWSSWRSLCRLGGWSTGCGVG